MREEKDTVLELGVDNFNQTGDDAAAIDARMQAFIEGLK